MQSSCLSWFKILPGAGGSRWSKVCCSTPNAVGPGCGGHFLDRASVLWSFGGRNYPRGSQRLSSAPKSTRQPEPAGVGGGATPVPRQVGLHLSCLHRGVFGVGMRKRSAGRALRLPEQPSGSEKGEKDIVFLQPFCRCPLFSFFSPK